MNNFYKIKFKANVEYIKESPFNKSPDWYKPCIYHIIRKLRKSLKEIT